MDSIGSDIYVKKGSPYSITERRVPREVISWAMRKLGV